MAGLTALLIHSANRGWRQTESLVLPAGERIWAFHEPQCAAGILPADRSEERTAGKMPAAPWRCRLIRRRFMVPMHAQKRKGALHEPLLLARRPPRPRPRLGGLASRTSTRTSRFRIPLHGRKAEEAYHKPTHLRPLPGGARAFVRAVSVPLLGEVRGGFMDPMRAKKARRLYTNVSFQSGTPLCAEHQPQRLRNGVHLGINSPPEGIRSCCGWSFGHGRGPVGVLVRPVFPAA